MQVRDFQSVIGKETRAQCLEQFGGKPDVLLACVGGGSNAIGLFHEFVDDKDVSALLTPHSYTQCCHVKSRLHTNPVYIPFIDAVQMHMAEDCEIYVKTV